MAALLLAAGTKGKRFALPHARILIHQPLGGVQGQATDIDIQAREILRMREELNRILVHHTGQSLDKIQRDTDRDDMGREEDDPLLEEPGEDVERSFAARRLFDHHRNQRHRAPPGRLRQHDRTWAQPGNGTIHPIVSVGQTTATPLC
jgi:hypothetical protein